MDSAERLSILESRVRRYLEERYAPGFTIQTHREFMPCHMRFKVRNPDGEPGPTLILPEEFVDHGDEIERELDARDVMGVMASAGKGIVVVPKVGQPVVEREQSP